MVKYDTLFEGGGRGVLLFLNWTIFGGNLFETGKVVQWNFKTGAFIKRKIILPRYFCFRKRVFWAPQNENIEFSVRNYPKYYNISSIRKLDSPLLPILKTIFVLTVGSPTGYAPIRFTISFCFLGFIAENGMFFVFTFRPLNSGGCPLFDSPKNEIPKPTSLLSKTITWA